MDHGKTIHQFVAEIVIAIGVGVWGHRGPVFLVGGQISGYLKSTLGG